MKGSKGTTAMPMQRSRHIPKEVVQQLFQEMRDRCCICRKLIDPHNFDPNDLSDYLEKHHIIYFAKGGEHTFENLLLVCRECHARIHAQPNKYSESYLRERKRHWIKMTEVVSPEYDGSPVYHGSHCLLRMAEIGHRGGWTGIAFSVETVNLLYTIYVPGGTPEPNATISRLAAFVRDRILRPLGEYDDNHEWKHAERVDLALRSRPNKPLDPDLAVTECCRGDDPFVANIRVRVVPIAIPRDLSANIRTELRSILRQREDLRQPLSRFEPNPYTESGQPPYYVQFDMRPRRKINGLRIGVKCLALPDERILDSAYRLAESVWHLKDRLKTWVEAQGHDIDVESYANSKEVLLIVADLANTKKHGFLERPRSGRSPRLGVIKRGDDGEVLQDGVGLVSFNTSKSGVIEFFYSGSRKEKELLVTNPVPIPFTIEVLVDDGTTSFGDAVECIHAAFLAWIPIIKDAQILEADDLESVELARELGL